MSLPMPMGEFPATPIQNAQAASILAALEGATSLLRQSLLAVNALPARVDQQLQDFKAQFQTEVTVPLQERMGKIEADQRDAILVTPTDRQEIKEAVAAKVREVSETEADRSKHFARLYGRLHKEFGICGYEHLRRVDMKQAFRYIAAYDGKRSTWPTK